MVKKNTVRSSSSRGGTSAAADSSPEARRWLLFVHQLPASPSNLRVRTWRRLQQIGALPVKQAAYVLPDTPGTREDFEWLTTEVRSTGGESHVFAADSIDRWADDALVEAFRADRRERYAELTAEIEEVLERSTATRRRRGTRAPAVERRVEGFRQRLIALEQIDFFGSAGGDGVRQLLARLEAQTRPTSPTTGPVPSSLARDAYQQRLWVTRPRPGVDRMSSAWLIRRFIDPNARFGFAADRDHLPEVGAIPFDMFGVEFSHQGDGCTFETLCSAFGITDPAVARLAAIVHDLDLKDGRFGAADAPTVGHIIDGLQLAHESDDELLERGVSLFDALHRAYTQALGGARPRPATPGKARAKPRRHAPSGGKA